jgi:hypothetical protein
MAHPRSGWQRVHARWLPETAPDRALIEGVFRPSGSAGPGRRRQSVSGSDIGAKPAGRGCVTGPGW